MSKGRKAPAQTQPAQAQQNACIAVAQQTERNAVITLLASEHTAQQPIQVAQQATWIATQLVEQLVDTRDIACRAGCAWCCSLFVSATPPEILQIVEYLRATRTAEELATLRERLAEREAIVAGKTAQQRSQARLPCVLLVDGQCGVYPARPLACGSWTATDARRCEASWRQHWATPITSNQMQLWLYGGVMLGLREGLDAYKLDSEQLDLATALRIALDHPDAADLWLAGEPLFASARVTLKAEDARQDR